jgi:D-3-phosphoglycerate dehydrogenase
MARIWNGPLKRALVVENPHDQLDEMLESEGMEVVRRSGRAPDTEELISLLQENKSQVLFKRSRVEVSRSVIEACPDLLAVQLCCIGDDSVDKQAAADHGVMVFNDPVSNGRSVVEMAIGQLISLSRRFYETNTRCRAGAWDKNNQERYEVKGKVLGILGLGNIGRAVARAADGLGMKICFFDSREVAREVGEEFGWESCDSLQVLFRNSDYLTVHLSARNSKGESNLGLLDFELLSQLGMDRPESSPRVFLNLSRGFLHEAEDLMSAISEGRIRRAAVDVYPREPRGDEKWNNPYAEEPRVIVTPHIGASTQEAQPRIARRVTQTLTAFSSRGAVRDCVFSPKSKLRLHDDGNQKGAWLIVGHANTRGTKRVISDAIYEAGASNLASVHKDFLHLDFAYDLASLDRPLSLKDIHRMVEKAAEVTGAPDAIRSVRQVHRESPGQ